MIIRLAAGLRRSLAGWCTAEEGASAVEFGLIGPILAVSLMSMADLGLAMHERMAMGHVLRAGAQSAMSDPGAATVAEVMKSTAQPNFTLVDPNTSLEGQKNRLLVSATRFCACPSALSTAVDCTGAADCGVGHRRAFYRLSASKTYAGMFLPAMNFSPVVQVQVQ